MPGTVDLGAVLDSIGDPILFADTGHVVRFMNKSAISHYTGGRALLGTSLLLCHNERSRGMMEDILEAMKAGEDERLISCNEERRVYMRAVRSGSGELLGYYERYERREPEEERSEHRVP